MLPWHKTKKEKQLYLTLYNEQMQPLYDGLLHEYAFSEQVILTGSEEFFNDPHPCEIHRRALQLRFYGEMEQLLPRGTVQAMKDTPASIQALCQQYHPSYILLEEK